MRLPVNQALPLAALICLGSPVAMAKDRLEPAPAVPTGPAADYPVVVGDPFAIGATTWTPTDQLNYDAVGYASIGAPELAGVTAAHKTLPLPSYVEVTSLDTGRTILVRVERRGPMVNDTLLELAPAAAAQLGLTPGSRTAIRLRRVNPPEQERAALRQGGTAAARMDTPEPLLKVLRRKLSTQSADAPPPSTPPAMPGVADGGVIKTGPAPVAKTPVDKAPVDKAPVDKTPVEKAPEPKAAPAKAPVAAAKAPVAAKSSSAAPATVTSPVPPAKGSLVVRVGAFSSEANARALAAKLGAHVDKAGKYWRVSAGPYANRGQAGTALEKIRAAGYRDALIQSVD